MLNHMDRVKMIEFKDMGDERGQLVIVEGREAEQAVVAYQHVLPAIELLLVAHRRHVMIQAVVLTLWHDAIALGVM